MRHPGNRWRIVLIAAVTCLVLALGVSAIGASVSRRSNLPPGISRGRTATVQGSQGSQERSNNPYADAGAVDAGIKTAGHQTNRPEGASS